MINNILTLLDIAKQIDMRSKYIDFALGKEKLPTSYKEVKNNLKLKK
jgi:hypothetical protein